MAQQLRSGSDGTTEGFQSPMDDRALSAVGALRREEGDTIKVDLALKD